jgi:predicted RNA polymerase sigma factor
LSTSIRAVDCARVRSAARCSYAAISRLCTDPQRGRISATPMILAAVVGLAGSRTSREHGTRTAGQRRKDALGGDPALASYGYLPAARADFLRRLGRWTDARTAYEEALLLTDNAVERDFLADQLARLPD